MILVLDAIKIEDFIGVDPYPLVRGRPPLDRTAMARSFIAKSVLNIPTTRAFIDRLNTDAVLRRICGFERQAHVPCEASFSNSFARFASARLAENAHEALVREAHKGVPTHNVLRDSTAIDAREKPKRKPAKTPRVRRKRGRPTKGEIREAPPIPRLERQLTMSLGEQLAELPTDCDHGFKTSAKGISTGWIG